MNVAQNLPDMIGRSPYHRLLGIEYVSHDAEAGVVRLGLDLKPGVSRSEGGGGGMHGGAIASLIDVAAAYSVQLVAGPGGKTVALSVDYLRPVSGLRAEAQARVVKSGRTQVVADIEVFDGERLAAIGRARFAVTEAA